eukprot:Selendium_serpulae@DN11407_c0_g1_i1.p1
MKFAQHVAIQAAKSNGVDRNSTKEGEASSVESLIESTVEGGEVPVRRGSAEIPKLNLSNLGDSNIFDARPIGVISNNTTPDQSPDRSSNEKPTGGEASISQTTTTSGPRRASFADSDEVARNSTNTTGDDESNGEGGEGREGREGYQNRKNVNFALNASNSSKSGEELTSHMSFDEAAGLDDQQKEELRKIFENASTGSDVDFDDPTAVVEQMSAYINVLLGDRLKARQREDKLKHQVAAYRNANANLQRSLCETARMAAASPQVRRSTT